MARAHKAVHRAAKHRPSTLAKVGALLAAPVPDVELLIGAMANPESGIKFVLGIARKAGRRASEVQSVIFDKLKWTADTAKGWLRDHGFTGTGRDEGATFWRFRQQSPGKYKEFRTVVPGARNPRKRKIHWRELRERLFDNEGRPFPVDDADYFIRKMKEFRASGGISDWWFVNWAQDPEGGPYYDFWSNTHRRDPGDVGPEASDVDWSGFPTIMPGARNPRKRKIHWRELRERLFDNEGRPFPVDDADYFIRKMKEFRASGGISDWWFVNWAQDPEGGPYYDFWSNTHRRDPGDVGPEASDVDWSGFPTIVPGMSNPRDVMRLKSEGRLLRYIVMVNGQMVFQSNDWTEARLKRDMHRMDGEPAELWERGKPGPSYLKSTEYRKVKNPTPGTSISSYQEHLATTASPEFRSATPGEQAAAMTAQDLCENPWVDPATVMQAHGWRPGAGVGSGWVHSQFPGHSFHTSSSGAWDHRLNGSNVGFGNTVRELETHLDKMRSSVPNPAYGQVKGRGWTQEWYETASGDARARTAQLRKLGYRVTASSMGSQVTPVGSVKMTLVDIRAGTSRDEELDNVPLPAGGVVRMNPSQFDFQRPDLGQVAFDAAKDFRLSGSYSETGVANARVAKYGFTKWWDNLPPLHRGPRPVRTNTKARLLKAWMEGWAAGKRVEKRNPESAAADLYEEFHGKPPGETLEIVTEKHEHEWLTQLGVLVELKIATLTNLEATIRFDKDAPQLCSSEDGRQLYIEGGDQSIDLKALKMDGAKWRKDSMALGVLVECTYQTEKGFQKFQLTDYYHRLGEETGVQPFVLYDPNNQLLSVSGGQYEVKPEGIVN